MRARLLAERRVQREHGLRADVQPGHGEALKEHLGRCLARLGRVERRLCEHDVVRLAVHAQVPAQTACLRHDTRT